MEQQILKDIKEIFTRLGKVETAVELVDQAKDFFGTEVKELKDAINSKDKNEAKRFDKLEEKQEKILKFMWGALGIGVTVQIVVMPLVLYIILKQ